LIQRIRKHIKKAQKHEINTAYDLALLIVEESSNVFFYDNEAFDVMATFESAIKAVV